MNDTVRILVKFIEDRITPPLLVSAVERISKPSTVVAVTRLLSLLLHGPHVRRESTLYRPFDAIREEKHKAFLATTPELSGIIGYDEQGYSFVNLMSDEEATEAAEYVRRDWKPSFHFTLKDD